MNKFKIQEDNRLIVVGTTGSGKTVLAKHLLLNPNLTRVVVIDPKHTFSLEGYKRGWSLPWLSNKFKLIVRPSKKDDEKLASLLYSLLGAGNVIIYIDELATMADFFKLSTAVLADIARTGREKKVGLWTATQRPAWIPKIFLTESEVYIMFQLRTDADRKYMAGLMGDDVRDPIQKYQFWFLGSSGEPTPDLLTYDLKNSSIKNVV